MSQAALFTPVSAAQGQETPVVSSVWWSFVICGRTELAGRVRLSLSPCQRRLRRLEGDGTIRGYRALIDPAAVGLGFEVLVHVTMDREDAATITQFEDELANVAAVRSAERLFGDPDYLLRVVTADLAAYQLLRDEQLATLPGVHRLSSTIVMKRIVDERPLPL